MKKTEVLELPKKNKKTGKPYLSYSQYSKWKSAKKDYIKSYFLGERFEGNAYTEFGSLIGEALENNDFSLFTEEEVKLLEQVTRLDQFEREITWDLGNFEITGYIDTNDLKRNKVTKIVDYKTGDMNKVAVYEDDEYDQVTIYAGAIEQETGKFPKEGWVELIERTGNAFRGEPLKLGTKVAVIPQDVTPEAIEAVRGKLIKVAKEISDSYKIFKQLNSITV